MCPPSMELNKINHRLVFKIKDVCELELKSLKTKKQFGRKKKKKKNADNVLNLEVVQVVLVQFNLVDNKYQQKSEALYTFTPNKYYAYLLNAEPSNLLFLKTCNIEFYEILIAFTDLNDRPLEIGNKVSLKLV